MRDFKTLAEILLDCVAILQTDHVSPSALEKVISRLKFVLTELTDRKG